MCKHEFPSLFGQKIKYLFKSQNEITRAGKA